MSSLFSAFGPEETMKPAKTTTTTTTTTLLKDANIALPPENEYGNVEYKLKLVDPTPARIEHLVTQMKWRLEEGNGKAIYEIGVEDNGGLKGLTLDEINASLKTLNLMAEKVGASVTIVNEKTIEAPLENRKAIEVLVKKLQEDQNVEVRVSVLGSADVGKSSLLGVLTQGELDNGNGKARLNLFRHRHEIRSGRTSSINKELLGFNGKGSPITYSNFQSSEEICQNSSKIVILCDSAGDPRYLKTTLASLTATHPDYLYLVVNASTGIDITSLSHLSLALALDLPIAIIFNKTDLCSIDKMQASIEQVKTLLLASFEKKSMLIENEDDIQRHFRKTNYNDTVPMFLVSCVTGYGLNLLYKFTYLIQSSIEQGDKENLSKQNPLFQIDEIFHIQDVGIVVSGFLRTGLIQEGDWLKIGPLLNGDFVSVSVSSVERHRVSRQIVKPNESSTLALTLLKDSDVSLETIIRKGMVLLGNVDHNNAHMISVCNSFRCRVLLISGRVVPNKQAIVYIENVRQNVIVKKISDADRPTLTIDLEFTRRPEFILPNYRLVLQQGTTTKCIGHITKVVPLKRN